MRTKVKNRLTGTGQVALLSVSTLLLLATGCGSGPSVATQIEELEAKVSAKAERNTGVEDSITKAIEDLEPGALEGSYESDVQYNVALETFEVLKSFAVTCGEDPSACGVLTRLPVDAVDLALPPDGQVEAKREFAEAVLTASRKLLSDCQRLLACSIVTTTTSPPPTTTRPRVTSPPRDESPSSYTYPSSPIVFLTCDSSVQDCWVERQNGRREFTSPYRVDGTKSSPSATTRFFDNFGNCWNVAVYEAPIPYGSWVKASSC